MASCAALLGLLALLGPAGCSDEVLDNTLAEHNADVEAIRGVGTCFTNGIDLLTRDQAAGASRWETCFTEDHSFEFTGEIPGTGMVATVSCPGEMCPAPAPQVGATSRAAFAAAVFEQNGYIATQHVLTNVVVTVDGDEGSLSSDLVAYHFRADRSVDIFNGQWQSDMVRVDGVWRSSHERAIETNFVTVSGGPLGEPSTIHGDALRELAKCYATGIDQIGAGELDAGKATWGACYTADFGWDFDFGPFGMFACPGDMCPAAPPGEGAGPRADFAGGTFAALGYTATQHLVTNLAVDVDLATGQGSVAFDLTAFHYLPDGSIDLFSGTVELTAVLGEGQLWRVSHESGDFTSFVRLESSPVPPPMMPEM